MAMNSSEIRVLAGFGNNFSVITSLIVSCVILYRVASFFWLYLRRGDIARYRHTSPEGHEPWALITGASDGIGRAFSHALAKEGFNIVLHGRNPQKLNAVLRELQREAPERSFRIIVADAGAVRCKNCFHGDNSDGKDSPNAGQRGGRGVDFAAIQAELKDLHLTVLVNNVGGGPKNPTFAPLQRYPAAYLSTYVSLDTLFPLHLTHALLPTLIQNKPALVLNMGSMVDKGLPYMSFYGGSKSFNMTLTKALAQELALQGHGQVEVLGIRVGAVTGVTWRDEEPNVLMPTAKTMAAAALGKVGSGRRTVFGYWGHALLVGTVDILPEWLAEFVAGFVATDLLRWMEEKEKRKET